MLERRLALIEGAEACRATATGMAAVNAALFASLKAGDRVVASRALFGACHWIVSTLLPRFGIESEFVDGADLAQWRAALSKPAALVLLESPSNPMLEIVDLRAVAGLAHAAGAIVVVDNVFATPLLQKPLQLGADVVVYSCTKHIDGQGRVLGGAVLGNRKWIEEALQPFPQHRPGAVALQCLAAAEGAGDTGASRRGGLPQCRRPRRFPGGSTGRDAGVVPDPRRPPATRPGDGAGQRRRTVVTFEIAGGKEPAFRVLGALRLVRVSNNLGDSKSLATHPATTTHMKIGERSGRGWASPTASCGCPSAWRISRTSSRISPRR